jgi:dolichyl-diphosphooligosaccharide--protein glycosyltransferase
MYKLCYYRFGEVGAEYGIYKLFCCKPLYLTIILGRAGGFDRVRNAEIGNKKVELKYFEEAYTTQHWLVRVYKLKKPSNLN